MTNRRKRLTSGYVLVIHEVTTTSVNVWAGALEPSIAKPKNWRLTIKKTTEGFSQEQALGNEVDRIEYSTDDGDVWLRPFDNLDKRFYRREVFNNLEAGQDYTIEFEARSENEWIVLETAFLTTLPSSLPAATEKPFTVGIGSCFYTKHDGGQAGRAYEALYKSDEFKPDIKFLAGDQVYVDIGLGLYPLDDEDCQNRIADKYAESWEYLRSLLRRGGTWMLADDHEYWNNYPYLKGFNPYLITLGLSNSFKRRWESAAKMGVDVVQQMQTIRTFSIGNDISFCIADLRTERTDNGFLSAESFNKLISWVDNLATPGVLVIPQPLIADKGDDNDSNLPDWEQYKELLTAIHNGDHDIVVLTGDVHYGRVSQVQIGNSGNKLIEVITSPISNLSELDGIAAATPKKPRKKFPFINIPEITKTKITNLGVVSTEQKWWDLRFPVRRTTEHFMTIEFTRDANKIKMNIHAWEARKTDKKTGLPKKIKRFKIEPITLN
jgi:hypothetical protein